MNDLNLLRAAVLLSCFLIIVFSNRVAVELELVAIAAIFAMLVGAKMLMRNMRRRNRRRSRLAEMLSNSGTVTRATSPRFTSIDIRMNGHGKDRP